MSEQKVISIADLKISNDLPFVLFGGMNVLESRELAMEVAAAYQEIASKLEIPYVFKASLIKPTVPPSHHSVDLGSIRDAKSSLRSNRLMECRSFRISTNLIRQYLRPK